MHRRQYLPGSRGGLKLNRGRLYAENKLLRERLNEKEGRIADQDAALQAWNREAIQRGWRAFLAAVKRFLSSPIRLRQRAAA